MVVTAHTDGFHPFIEYWPKNFEAASLKRYEHLLVRKHTLRHSKRF